jgi:CHASE2 domain-containing sensor protein/predicted Ser/Thr protein kinase
MRPAGMRDGVGRGRRLTALLAAALLAATFGFISRAENLLRRPEQQTIDARFQIRGAQPQRASRVVLVNIDDATFNAFRAKQLHAQWPFPRRYHARVIERLRVAGARVVAVDLQFTEPSDPIDDNALIEAVGRDQHVVLSTTEVGPHGSTNVLGGDEVLRSVRARAANTSLIPDSDGTVRRTQYSIVGLRTFGVVVDEAFEGRPVRPALFGGREEPVPIDYVGPPGTVSSISYSRVYDGSFPSRMFAGKIVIIGASSTSLQDLHQTPVSGSAPMPGPEVLANESATVLGGIPLRRASIALTLTIIALLSLLVPLAGVRLGTLGVALAGLGLLIAWSLCAQIVFDSGTQLDFADPAASLVLATGGAALVGMRTDAMERRRLRARFAASEPAVVRDVLEGSMRGGLAPTAVVAGYRIEEQIGRGGMGVVYRATQLALDRSVAIKLIATEHAHDSVFRERFKLESKLAASIEHVSVIPVYEAGEDDGLLFIAMRLVDGEDLAELLRYGERLEPDRVVRLIGQLAGALDAAHARGLVHRDVKPANVLLTRDAPEHVYLTDFGVAKQLDGGDGLTRGEAVVGTLDYLAPEQIRGDPLDGAADIYALTGLLYHCLTGEIPFPRDSDVAKLWAHINADPPSPSRLQPSIAPSVDEVIGRGMAKDPRARYRSGAELIRACALALGIRLAAPARPRPGASDISAKTEPRAVPTKVSD